MSNPREEGRAPTRARSSSSPNNMAAIGRLTDGLLLEILSRVPAKSLCRFKCAFKRWLGLVDNPDHRRKLPQSLVGFFFNSKSEERYPRSALHFVNTSGSGRPFIYPSFTFLPDRRRLHLLDCCNGLVLCRWYDVSTTQADEFRYIVCNPATEKWVALPDRSQSGKVGTARLGFDPATSHHFHVFVLLLDARHYISGVDLYSSETRRWVYKEKGWDENVRFADPKSATVFLNGYLHLRTACGWQQHPRISAVDTKGETWSNFDTPCGLYGGELFLGFIQQSQGHLHYASFTNGDDEDDDEVQLQVYALEDYAKTEWIVKHRVELSDVDAFGGVFEGEFDWIAIHPESNLIFFIEGSDNTLMCYNMDHRKATEVRTLGEGKPPYLPYMPLYKELESLRM